MEEKNNPFTVFLKKLVERICKLFFALKEHQQKHRATPMLSENNEISSERAQS